MKTLIFIVFSLFFYASSDKHHPSHKQKITLYEEFTEPVCDVNEKCEIPMAPMDPSVQQIRHWDKQEETSEYWEELTMQEVRQAEKVTENLNKNKAKYSIIFLGDGMGIPSITAGRIYSGQKLGMINAESYKTGIDKVANEGHTQCGNRFKRRGVKRFSVNFEPKNKYFDI